MAEFPAMPFWTDAYLGDTTHLSTLEHGAYTLLLWAMWRSGEARLPADDARLARYAKLRIDHWLRMRPIIMDFFDLADGYITQARLQDEWLRLRKKSRLASNAANAKWLKNKNTRHADAELGQCRNDALHTHTHSEERKKEANGHSGGVVSEGKRKPRHGQKSKQGFIWLDRGTSEWNAYAGEYALRHAGMAPPTQWNGSGTWFNLTTGDA